LGKGLRRKRLIVLVVTIVLLAVFLIMQAFGVTEIGARIKFRTIDQGELSQYEGSGYFVINDADQWANLWSQHVRNPLSRSRAPPPPNVDFSNSTIIAVFLGFRPTTGYGIEVKEIIDTGLTVVVKVQQTHSDGMGEMITYPYHIVEAGKITKYIIFTTFTLQ
jgi:hypothetical protein